jgi:hypothetical protein
MLTRLSRLSRAAAVVVGLILPIACLFRLLFS